MLSGSSWWRHIRPGRHGCSCKIWWFYVKQWWNKSTLWLATHVLRTTVQYLIAFCNRMEAVSDVISGGFVGLTVPNKRVKVRDPHLKPLSINLSRSHRIRHFRLFFRPEVARECHVQCGCRSCRCGCPWKKLVILGQTVRVIWATHFVMGDDEWRQRTQVIT